jgi:hypothetical protein
MTRETNEPQSQSSSREEGNTKGSKGLRCVNSPTKSFTTFVYQNGSLRLAFLLLALLLLLLAPAAQRLSVSEKKRNGALFSFSLDFQEIVGIYLVGKHRKVAPGVFINSARTAFSHAIANQFQCF